MKQSKTVLKELTAAYRAVLRHGILCNAIALGLMVATPAMAEPVLNVGKNVVAFVTGDNILNSQSTAKTIGSRYDGTFPGYETHTNSISAVDVDGLYVGNSVLKIENTIGQNAVFNWQKGTEEGLSDFDIFSEYFSENPVKIGDTDAAERIAENVSDATQQAYMTVAATADSANSGSLYLKHSSVTIDSSDIIADKVDLNDTSIKIKKDLESGAGITNIVANKIDADSDVVFETDKGTSFSLESKGEKGVFANSTNRVFVNKGEMNLKNLRLRGNSSSNGGGAIYNNDMNAVLEVHNSEFLNNSSVNKAGGAINNNKGTVTINNSDFYSNSATSSGGAVYNATDHTMELINDTFGAEGKGNRAEQGGAIASKGLLTVEDNNISYNQATYGGGISVLSGTADIKNTTFSNNNANQFGGALYLNTGSSTKINDSKFLNNTVLGVFDDEENDFSYAYLISNDVRVATVGSAIYAKSKMEIKHSDFIGNVAGDTTVYAKGGLKLENSTFKNNIAKCGYSGITDDVDASGKTEIENSIFENNSSDLGGAVALFSRDYESTITDSQFINNSATYSIEDDAELMSNMTSGAVFLGSESKVTITDTEFVSNKAALKGAAISTGPGFETNNNSGAKLDIVGSTFTANTTLGNGAAIWNMFYNSNKNEGYVTVDNSEFASNESVNGGAIYNDGSLDVVQGKPAMKIVDSEFTGNVATTNGGAIYNAGTLVLSGTNKFSGNKAQNSANDIYNVGDLTIANGTTTINGGITGNGDLTIDSGATLNIGTTAITQDSITLNGTLIADLVANADSILNATTKFDGSGKLSLAIEKAGTYNLFGGEIFAKAKEQIVSTVYDLDWTTNDGKTVVATVKSADKIAQETGVSTESATAVSRVAKSESKQLQELSVKLQEKLANGDTASVEHATKAIHPETESVAQSVSSSVQNTVVNAAAARMAMPSIGRSAGDVNLTSGAVWAQGIFNKTKQNDAFHGYTRGVAAGLDGTINKVWTIGAAYSFAHSDVTGSARDTKIDSNTLFLYGQYKPSQWYLNAIANYTWSDYSENGSVIDDALVFADYDVQSFGGHIATGYNFDNGITPELGLRYMHVNADDYTNSYGIKTSMKDTDFLTGMAGAKYVFDITSGKHAKFTPELKAGVKYDLLSDKSVATIAMPGVDAYTIDGNRLNRLGGEFGIGLGMTYDNLQLSVNYDIDVRKDYTSQTGMLKFRYNF